MAERHEGTSSADVVRRRRLPSGPQAAPSATKAIDDKHADGTPGVTSERTVLQQHLDFFDPGAKGFLLPSDTYLGFRRIGFSRLFSAASVLPLHSTFAFATWPDWRPRPWLPIFLERAHRCKHGSDSGTFDTEGRFTPAKFAEIFSKYATMRDASDNPALSFANLQDMLHGNMAVNDGVGWVAARLEWWTLWLIAQDERGMLSQERVRAAFDGTLWPQLEEQALRRRGYDVAPWVAKRPLERDQAPPAVAGKAVIPRGPREGREPTGGEAAKEE
jgi:peroxygenase